MFQFQLNISLGDALSPLIGVGDPVSDPVMEFRGVGRNWWKGCFYFPSLPSLPFLSLPALPLSSPFPLLSFLSTFLPLDIGLL